MTEYFPQEETFRELVLNYGKWCEELLGKKVHPNVGTIHIPHC